MSRDLFNKSSQKDQAIYSIKLQAPVNIPLVATNFKDIAAQFPLADLREILDLPSELPIKICGFGSYIFDTLKVRIVPAWMVSD